MATVEQDTFSRPDASTWNPASNGDIWTFPGVAETYSITSDRGLEGSLTGGDWHGVLGANTTDTPNVLVRTKVDDALNFTGVLLRYTSSSGVNAYRLGLFSGQIKADKFINGTRTAIGVNVNFTYDTTHYYWIRGIADGSSLSCAVWLDGDSEPSPQWTLTDTSVTGAGKVGLSAFMSSGNNSYDSFLATNNQSLVRLATLAQATFKIRASLDSHARATFKIRAMLATSARATFKIRTGLATLARSSFKIRAALANLARAAFKVRAVQSTPARATFKIQNVLTQQTPGVATISDASHGSAVLSDVLVDQASGSDAAVGSVTLSDQG